MTTTASPRMIRALAIAIVAVVLTASDSFTRVDGRGGLNPQDAVPSLRPKPLFTPVAATRLASSDAETGITRGATLRISSRTLASDVIVNADAHLLNLFADVQIVAFRNRVESRPRGDYSWFGSIPGDELGRVILTIVGGKLGAYITNKGRKFMVRPIVDDLYEVIEIDDELVDFHDGPAREGEVRATGDADQTVTPRETSRTIKAVGTGPLDSGGLIRWFNLEFAKTEGDVPSFLPADDNGSVIDVLMFYSQGAANLTDPNSVVPSNLLLRVQQMIDGTNQSFWDSGVSTRLNLLWNTALAEADLVDSGDLETDLATWEALSAIAAARDAFAADIVVFVTGSSEVGGKFSPLSLFAAVGAKARPLTFAHEIGHVMGLQHDWDKCLAEGTCPLPSNWETATVGEHGYVQVYQGATKALRSIMAYPYTCELLGIPDDSCDWELRWSNPNVILNGLPFGREEGTPYPSDEVLKLNQSLFSVANRKKSACRLLSQC